MSKRGAVNELVKTLTKTEKRYLTLNTQLHSGDKQYIKVLKEILSESRVDDTIDIPHTAITKNYLGKLILKSLKNFNEGKSKNSVLLHLLLEIEILFQKQLYDHCMAHLRKGKKLAYDHDRYALLLEFLTWERKILSSRTAKDPTGLVDKLTKEENNVIGLLDNHNQYQLLINQLMESDFTDTSAMIQFQNHQLLANKEKALGFHALIIFYHMHYILYTVTGNNDAGRDTLITLVEYLEQYPDKIKENPQPYITSLNNLMSTHIYSKEPVEALKILTKIRGVPEEYELIEKNFVLNLFIKTYNIELELYRDLQRWEDARKLILDVEKFIERNTISTNYLLSFYYQFGYVYFQLGAYSTALKHVNNILNENYGDTRTDLQTYARFLFLMIHFELGNMTLLKYAVENTRRFLKKNRGSLFAFERELLKFFSKLSTVNSYRYKELFENLSESLFRKHDRQQTANILDYLDFTSWIESHVSNKSINRPTS